MPASPEVVQHWMLNILVECCSRASILIPFVETISLNQVHIPGCSAEECAVALLALYDSGKIELSDRGMRRHPYASTVERSVVECVLGRRLEMPRKTSLRRQPKRCSLRPLTDWIGPRDANLEMRLTQRGGAAWEAMANPDWTRYFGASYDYPGHPLEVAPEDECLGEAWSPSLEFLMAQLAWSEEHQPMKIDRRSLKIVMEPQFELTYWKTMPAYRATFSCRWAEQLPRGWENSPGSKWFRDGKDATYRWCTLPRELEGWPTDVRS